VIRSISLEDGQTGLPIEAEIVTLTTSHVVDYEESWMPLLRAARTQDAESFNWRLKQEWTVRSPGMEGYALTVNGINQGMILIETQRRWSRFGRSRLVYVESVASAPWNRKLLQQPPHLKNVGRSLLSHARQRSLALGYQGSVGLHSFPESVRFYEELGLTRWEPGTDDMVDESEDLPYFEYMPLRQNWEFYDDE
jgi:hypothetical protein